MTQLSLGSSNFRSPGPIYMPRSTQTNTAPVFGSAPRFKETIGKDAGPGPSYNIPPERGPSFTIKGRFQERIGGTDSTPGPGAYRRLETSQTRKDKAPAYSIRSRRTIHTTNDFTPAPGHSQSVTSATKQVLSTKRNLPSVKFTQGVRREAKPEDGPAPSDYDPKYIQLSGYKKPPAFSLSGRPVDRSAEKIQPEMHLPIGGIGKQVISTKKTAPAASMSGRTKFGSPYFL